MAGAGGDSFCYFILLDSLAQPITMGFAASLRMYIHAKHAFGRTKEIFGEMGNELGPIFTAPAPGRGGLILLYPLYFSRIIHLAHNPGRLGGERVTVQGLEIARIYPERNLVLIKGSIPGPKRGLVMIKSSVKA